MTTSNSKRILIADDDLKTQTLLGSMLANEGHEISHAASGKEAIALHSRTPFDLVITELGMDGFEVLKELRRQPAPVKIITTFKTSWLPAELCHRMGKQLGAHCVLTKPLQSEQLLAAVRSAMG
jgi:DNA-binding response OmpR family regulator